MSAYPQNVIASIGTGGRGGVAPVSGSARKTNAATGRIPLTNIGARPGVMSSGQRYGYHSNEFVFCILEFYGLAKFCSSITAVGRVLFLFSSENFFYLLVL